MNAWSIQKYDRDKDVRQGKVKTRVRENVRRLGLSVVSYPNSYPLFSLHSRRHTLRDKGDVPTDPIGGALSGVTRQRNYKRLWKTWPRLRFSRSCETRRNRERNAVSPPRHVPTLEIHARRRDKEGREEATRPPRCTRFEGIPKLENALKAFGGRRLGR